MTIIYYEDDRNHGPFIIRVSGTREFVSRIKTSRAIRHRSFQLLANRNVFRSKGIHYSDDPNEAVQFDCFDAAIEAAKEVFEQDHMQLSIEIAGGFCD